MEILRLTLNPNTAKELVVRIGTPHNSLEIWKGGQLLETFTYHEIKLSFRRSITGVSLINRIDSFLKGFRDEFPNSYIRLPSHTIEFTYLRSKPFVLIERCDSYPEIDGVPQFTQVYFGLTAWDALFEHYKDVISALKSSVVEE